jgi:hypothetical protein
LGQPWVAAQVFALELPAAMTAVGKLVDVEGLRKEVEEELQDALTWPPVVQIPPVHFDITI